MDDAKFKIRKGTLYNRRMLNVEVWENRVHEVESLILEFIHARKITICHVFLPIQRNKEFDSWNLVKLLHNQGIKVVISVSDFQTFSMQHFHFEPEMKFNLNKFDIPEPVDGTVADISLLQMILIPLLAADKEGNRIGYGKGFYDRLLMDMPKDLLKVGVNLGPLFDRFDFAEAHDVKLDYCITPHKIYHCHD